MMPCELQSRKLWKSLTGATESGLGTLSSSSTNSFLLLQCQSKAGFKQGLHNKIDLGQIRGRKGVLSRKNSVPGLERRKQAGVAEAVSLVALSHINQSDSFANIQALFCRAPWLGPSPTIGCRSKDQRVALYHLMVVICH